MFPTIKTVNVSIFWCVHILTATILWHQFIDKHVYKFNHRSPIQACLALHYTLNRNVHLRTIAQRTERSNRKYLSPMQAWLSCLLWFNLMILLRPNHCVQISANEAHKYYTNPTNIHCILSLLLLPLCVCFQVGIYAMMLCIGYDGSESLIVGIGDCVVGRKCTESWRDLLWWSPHRD